MYHKIKFTKSIAAKMMLFNFILIGLTGSGVFFTFHYSERRMTATLAEDLSLNADNANMMKSLSDAFRLSKTVILILFGILAAASALLIRFFVFSHIRRPIKMICDTIDEIRSGNPDSQPALCREDEWHVIEDAIHHLNADLKSSCSELKNTRRHLRLLMDSSPSVIIGVDQDGRIVQWNRRAESAAGISRKDAVGKNIRDVMPESEHCFRQIEESVRAGNPATIERTAVFRKNRIQFTDVFVFPFKENGAQGAVIRMEDVTHRVRFEEIMVQTDKMTAVGGLAAGMAHEINNPLGGILGAVQVIEIRLSPDNQRNSDIAAECGIDIPSVIRYMDRQKVMKFIDNIKIAGIRAAKIVQDMLNFSRGSESGMELCAADALIENTISLASVDYDLKKKYDFRNIEIIREFGPNLPQIRCKVTEIEQVLLNLLKNAARSLAANKDKNIPGQIALRTLAEKDGIRIEVEDNGTGMDEATRKRVFEPFFSAGAGTGLGLSASDVIITRNHRGKLSVESEPGKGAKFIIQLPTERNDSGSHGC